MGIFQQFPYSNFHEMNLDQIIKIMREMQDEWAATKAEWASYKEFIDNYFANLDVSEEVLLAIRTLASTGELNTLIDPVIISETASWLAEHITITEGSTVIDDTLSIEGAAADAKATGDAINYLTRDLRSMNNMNDNLLEYANWSTGDVNPTTGDDVSSLVRLRTDYIKITGVSSFKVHVALGYKYGGYLIDTTNSQVVHTIPWTIGTVSINLADYPAADSVRFVLQKTDNTLPDSGNYLTCIFSTILFDTINRKMNSENIDLILQSNILTSGSLQTSSMTVSPNQACVSYLTKIPVTGGEQIKIEPPTVSGVDHYTYRFGFYDTTGTYINQIATTTNPVCTTNVNNGFISFMICGYDSDNQQVSFNLLNAFDASDAIKVVFLDRWVNAEDLATIDWVEQNFEPAGNSGYVINGANIKQGVSSVRLGELKYLQAFCVYNGKYYSIDGSNIAEQDSDFNVLRDVALNTGHGNSLQLGHNGKAYASGWNDSTIYVIDLATLTIVSTITLPVTGYFSAVVDDLNNIAYILHRTSYPDTVANYTFTVYDITNASTISSRIVNAFGALQGCDYSDGKVIACYGLGNITVPNGITVYNSMGDIISTFDLNLFSITEIEGVAFDRNSTGIYTSLYNKSIYKIS